MFRVFRGLHRSLTGSSTLDGPTQSTWFHWESREIEQNIHSVFVRHSAAGRTISFRAQEYQPSLLYIYLFIIITSYLNLLHYTYHMKSLASCNVTGYLTPKAKIARPIMRACDYILIIYPLPMFTQFGVRVAFTYI